MKPYTRLPNPYRTVQGTVWQLANLRTDFQQLSRFVHKPALEKVARSLLKQMGNMNIRLPIAAKSRGAFSLIEGVVSMGVLGVVVSILLNGLTAGFFTVRMARENLRATQIMLEKAETLRLYTWSQITNSTYIKREFTVPFDPRSTNSKGAIYNGTIEIEPAPMAADYSDDLRMVTIKINWKTGGLSRHREFRSLVSRYGMQDYIY